MDIITHQTNLLSIDLTSERNIFDFVKNGIAITNEQSVILYTNPAFTTITGYTKEEVKGQNPGMLHSGKHDATFYKALWQDILTKGFWEGEIWNRRKSGQIYPEFLTISKVTQQDTEQFYYIAIFSDITFLKKDINKNMQLAFYDPLTELPNRNLYLDRVNSVIEQAKNQTDKTVAIFYMDLDKFKQVNDTYGHCAGDQLLKMVGERFASITRAGDTIARIGGDEFAAILSANCEMDLVKKFANRIVTEIEKPFAIEGHEVNVSISIGISFYPNDASQIDKLLARADQAMYKAKKNHSRIEFYQAI